MSGNQGLVVAMGQAYRDPRGAMALRIAGGLSETGILAHVFIACGLGFVASLPNAIRTARDLAIDEPLAGAIAAHLFGYFVVAPLLLYAFAALVHLAARAFGGGGGFQRARAAVAWSALLAGPIAMALALIGVVAEAVGATLLPWLSVLGYAGLAFWLWLFAASLAEAEGFPTTGRVAAVLALGFAGVVASVTLLIHGTPGTG